MTYPSDSATNIEAWKQSTLDLSFALEAAMELPEIAEMLDRENLSYRDARDVILENPTVLARIRTAGNWLSALLMGGPGSAPARHTRRLADASPATRIGVAAAIVVIYLGLQSAAWPGMPWVPRLASIVGLFAIGGLAVMLGGEDLLGVLSVVLRARNRDIRIAWVLDQIVVPELRQYIIERRESTYGTILSAPDPDELHRLYGDDDDSPTVITATGQRLRRILERSTWDAVAVAGRRGVGKSTMIRAVARGLFCDVAPV